MFLSFSNSGLYPPVLPKIFPKLSSQSSPQLQPTVVALAALTALTALAALYCPSIHAQTSGGTPSSSPAITQLREITVIGNPLGSQELIAPAAQYSGTELLLRSQTTLGETLNGLPGVSSSYFGPNASRPMIRGLDGDRVRILNNSGASLDASSLSYDHAVTIDPLSIERIEVLRGPGALQYGGSAVGGVVNVIDNRIAREPQFDAPGGVMGKVDLGLATGNREKSTSALLEAGNQRYALHVDVFQRQTADVKVPQELPCEKAGVYTLAKKICNSASKAHGGAVGGSLFFDQGYVGASVNTYRNDYGTVAEDNVTIAMKSTTRALQGELRFPGAPIQSIQAQFSQTDYAHTELEGATPGTLFKNKGHDLRLQVKHAKFANFEGLLGFQSEKNRFSADGAEAFAPYSQTRQNAVFAYEEYGTSWGKLSLGGRWESVKVESFGNALVPRFVPGSRDFKPSSYALGGLWNMTPRWQLTSNLAYTERAPKDYELYAQGPHIATQAWETGDASLGKERSTSIDVGLAWKSGANSFSANTYLHRFSNYIGLLATGNTYGQENGVLNPLDANGDGIDDSDPDNAILPEQAYTGVHARFIGLEASGNIRLLEGASTLDLALRGDVVRATNLNNGQALPRIAPARLGATLRWAQGPWGASLGLDHAMAQNRVAQAQRATSAYTLWNLSASYRMKAGPSHLLWYAKVDNLSNTLAYSATSILTSTAFPKAPLPGRTLKLGLQVAF